jgi:hypothetical protein
VRRLVLLKDTSFLSFNAASFIIKNLVNNKGLRNVKRTCISLIQLQVRMAYVSLRVDTSFLVGRFLRPRPFGIL